MTNTRLSQTARQNMYQASIMSSTLENMDPAVVPPQLAYLVNKNLAVQAVSAIQGRRHGEWMGTALDCQMAGLPQPPQPVFAFPSYRAGIRPQGRGGQNQAKKK